MIEDYKNRERPAALTPSIVNSMTNGCSREPISSAYAPPQGWSELITYALNVSPTGLRDQATVHLRLGAGLSAEALPAWAWSIIDEADGSISADLRQEMGQEAAVLLRKPCAVSARREVRAAATTLGP